MPDKEIIPTKISLSFLIQLQDQDDRSYSSIHTMRGHWIGILQLREMKHKLILQRMWHLKSGLCPPFVKIYLKKQQEQFVPDLKMHWNNNFRVWSQMKL